MKLNVSTVSGLIEEYLIKFPESERKNIEINIGDDWLHIINHGSIQSLRIVNVIINVFLKFLDIEEADKFFQFDLSLSIEESLMNIYNHSYPNGQGDIEIMITIFDDIIAIDITDYGPKGKELNLENVLNKRDHDRFAPRGRGFLLIKKAVDEIKYQTNSEKNILHLKKYFRRSNNEI